MFTVVKNDVQKKYHKTNTLKYEMKCGAKQYFYNHLILQNINLKGDIILAMLGDVIHVVNLQFVLKIFYSISPVQANIM